MFHLKVIVSLLHKIAGNGINWRPARQGQKMRQGIFFFEENSQSHSAEKPKCFCA